jgi:potassium-dependent mechanosensitive channel
MQMMTGKPGRALAFPVFALLAALAAPTVAFAATGGPSADASVTAAVQQPTAKVPQTPVPVPIPEIAQQADAVARLLHTLDAIAVAPPEIEAIQARLPEVSAQLGPGLESTLEILKGGPRAPIVDRLDLAWQASRQELAGWQAGLTKRATQLEAALAQVATLRARWTGTRADAVASGAPAAVGTRVDALLADIEATRARLQAQDAAALVLLDQAAQGAVRCEEALDRIAQFRRGRLALTFVRGTLPIWSPEVRWQDLAEVPARAGEAVLASGAVLRQFITDRADRVRLHGLLFLGLILLAQAARRRARSVIPADEASPSSAALFTRPYSAAALAALASVFWLYPDRPQTVGDLVGILLMLPLLRLCLLRVKATMVPALYGCAALVFVDRLRAELVVVPLAEQLLLLLVNLVAMGGLVWLLRSGRLRQAPAGDLGAAMGLPDRRAIAALALAVYAVSSAAGASGYMNLGRMLGAAVFVALYMALVAYTAVQVADGLLGFALRVWPLRGLGMVERHRALLERRFHLAFCWIAVFGWARANLRFHGIFQPLQALGQAVLAMELRQGTIGITVGEVIAFFLTVWLAFLLSAFIRFVLVEDVYPRLHLARGLPYVISSLLNYAILFLGFLLAVGALGVDLNKVTVLAGAFGVGLGFGLQGVVNNFVSGLIVLFERPINVGDAIRMSDVEGEVRRIGIRSTTVRTAEGADIIVPNASLVAEKVTNWTYSDHLRRMDVRVGVAYGTAPQRVLALLHGVAASHPGVLADPAPLALFLSFGDSALNFELRAWTDRFAQWVVIRSELSVAVYTALQEAGIEIPLPQQEVRLRQG